ncbi:UNVERIFIED_ORG: PAS domain S-box-containing protein [Burkholderia sp. CF145]
MVSIGWEMGIGRPANEELAVVLPEQRGTEPDGVLRLTSFALDRVREAAYLIDRQGRFIYVNEEASRELGYDRAQLLHMSVMDIDPDWNPQRWRAGWHELREKGSLLFESTHQRRDGTEFPVEVRASYVEYGGSPCNLALARDVSERKKAEVLLASKLELEAQFRQFAESIPDIICRYDGQCRLVYGNSVLASIIGRPVDEVRGLTPMEFDPAYKVFQQALAGALETGAERSIDLTLRENTPEVRYYHFRIIPEHGCDNQISGVLVLGRDFTERKEAEERLHASEQAFRAVVEHSTDYIARHDREGRCVYANPAMCGVLQHLLPGGSPRTDIVGQSLLADDPEYMDRLRQVVVSGTQRIDEVRFRNAQGLVRWGHVRTVPEFAPDGQVGSVLSICRDVDELKRSEQLFSTLAESHPDLIARFDHDCKPTYVNPRVVETFGTSREDLIGKRLHELNTHDRVVENELLEAGIRRAFATGEANALETQWGSSANRRVTEVRHIPETDVDGNVVSVLGLARDITHLRKTELALRGSETAFRTLAENAPAVIARYDHKGCYSYVNPRFEQVTGLLSSDVIGKTPSELSTAARPGLTGITEMLATVIAKRTGVKLDLDWELAGKSVGWEVSAVPEPDAAGNIHGVLTIWTDITERREAERRLRESYALLQEATTRRETAREEERKQLARELHDELGQQLTALRLWVSALRIEFGCGDPELDNRLRHLLNLCDGTMEVVRHVIASLRPAALDAGVVPAFEWLAAEFSRDSRIACSLRMPEADDSLAFDGKRSVAMFRIVQEALTNIIRHAQASQVEISLTKASLSWNLEIRDDGCGFDWTLARPKSFGLLGMRERALALGGELSILSAPGEGTSIVARIPVSDLSGQAVQAHRHRTDSGANSIEPDSATG